MREVSRRGLLGAALLCVWGCRRREVKLGPLRVAAAADLQDAFTALAALYQEQHGRAVALSFAASGLLTRQVREGAPFDLLATASPRYIDELARLDLLVPRSRLVFARGQLALYSLAGADGGSAQAGAAPLSALLGPRVRRIALANPEHAPYGAAALLALQGAGLYPALQGKLVFAENVRQALRFAETGAADVALVARSLCGAAQPRGGRCEPLPEGLHPPIEQALGVLRGGDEAGAARFVALLRGGRGQEILRRHGYQLPQQPAGRAPSRPEGEGVPMPGRAAPP